MSEHEYYEQTNECANKRCARPLGKWVLAPTYCDKCESELREAEEEIDSDLDKAWREFYDDCRFGNAKEIR